MRPITLSAISPQANSGDLTETVKPCSRATALSLLDYKAFDKGTIVGKPKDRCGI